MAFEISIPKDNKAADLHTSMDAPELLSSWAFQTPTPRPQEWTSDEIKARFVKFCEEVAAVWNFSR